MHPSRIQTDSADTGLLTVPTGIAGMWLNTTSDVIDDLVESGHLIELTPGRIQIDSMAAFVRDENPDLAMKLRVLARTLLAAARQAVQS
jgi:hypothetical protein